MKVFNIDIKTEKQDYEGTISCNGGEPVINLTIPINCEKQVEESFHRLLNSFVAFSKKSGGVSKIEFNLEESV